MSVIEFLTHPPLTFVVAEIVVSLSVCVWLFREAMRDNREASKRALPVRGR